MSSVYVRGRSLWIAFTDAQGRRRGRASGERVVAGDSAGNERAIARARAIARELDQLMEEERRGERAAGPPTLAAYARGWVAARKARRLSTACDNEAGLRDHVLPALGRMLLEEVRPRDVRQLFRRLMDGGRLAPKTVLNLYGTLHRLFADAVADELREASPCVLQARRGELPEKQDKDPLWRRQAVFTRAEARRLCMEEVVPWWRRVLYAGLFFGGVRIGEMLGRRWSDLDASRSPLHALSVHSAWNSKLHEERGTKTRRVRLVPVHPEWARTLAAWRLSGWAALTGRHPTVDDWIIPHARSAWFDRPRSSKSILKALQLDCRRLGLRPRRIHDMRRSFISWARSDGAQRDLLKWVTHGPGRAVIDDYTEPEWESLCAQVLVLRLDLVPAPVVQLDQRASRDGHLGPA